MLTDLVKAQPPDTARSAPDTATLQDALRGLGLATAKLCQISPGHAALQEALELLFRWVKATSCRAPAAAGSTPSIVYTKHCLCRHSKIACDSAGSQQLATESASAVAGLCLVFKACGRSCCLACLQLLKQPTSHLHASICAFLHTQLLAPVLDHELSDPDLGDHGPDTPCLAEEAFEQPSLVDTLKAAVQHLSGLHMHATCPVIACGEGRSWKACLSNDCLRSSLLVEGHSLPQTMPYSGSYNVASE